CHNFRQAQSQCGRAVSGPLVFAWGLSFAGLEMPGGHAHMFACHLLGDAHPALTRHNASNHCRSIPGAFWHRRKTRAQ
ncbi:MAG: hypothetical protein P4L57_06015, partial [Rhizomicrobium sp.]|nr:hypothetical protein [Rhizomicrobium sp.]